MIILLWNIFASTICDNGANLIKCGFYTIVKANNISLTYRSCPYLPRKINLYGYGEIPSLTKMCSLSLLTISNFEVEVIEKKLHTTTWKKN